MMMEDEHSDNSWIAFASIDQSDIGREEIKGMVKEGVLDKNENMIRFRDNKVFNSVLQYYA